MALKLFRRSEFRKTTQSNFKPVVTLRKCDIAIGKFFEQNLGNRKCVQLWYDDEQQTIQIKLCLPEDEEALPLLRNKTGGGRVAARVFFRWAKIETGGAQAYEATYLESKRSIIVFLERPVGEPRKPIGKKTGGGAVVNDAGGGLRKVLPMP